MPGILPGILLINTARFMIYRVFDPSNPFLWLFLTGFLIGLGIGRLPFLYSRHSFRRTFSSGASLFVSVCFSTAVLSAGFSVFATAGGLFTGRPVDLSVFSDPIWILPFSGLLILGLLVRRFPRAAGIPIIIVFTAALVFLSLAFSSWSPYLPGEEVLRVQVVTEKGAGLDDDSTEPPTSVVKITFPPDRELLLTLNGQGVRPVVEQLRCSPLVFFMGTGYLYRVTGIAFNNPEDIIEPFYSPFSKFNSFGDALAVIGTVFPFIEYSRDTPEEGFPDLNQIFTLFLDEEGCSCYNELLPF